MKKILIAIGIILVVFLIAKGIQQYNYNLNTEIENEHTRATSGVDTSK